MPDFASLLGRTGSGPPRVLFVHNGAPGRFGPLAAALLARGWEGALINGPTGTDIVGLANRRFALPARKETSSYPPARRIEDALLMGRGAAGAAQALKDEGFVPELVVGHPGWGEMLFLKEVFPGVP